MRLPPCTIPAQATTRPRIQPLQTKNPPLTEALPSARPLLLQACKGGSRDIRAKGKEDTRVLLTRLIRRKNECHVIQTDSSDTNEYRHCTQDVPTHLFLNGRLPQEPVIVQELRKQFIVGSVKVPKQFTSSRKYRFSVHPAGQSIAA